MKNLKIIVSSIFLLTVLFMKAQQPFRKDFFEGKWDVMVYGTAKGDQRMIIELKRINGKLQGAIIGPTDDIKKFTKIEEIGDGVKLSFKYLIFNVHLFLKRKDENNVSGKLEDEYKAIGKRMK